MKIRLTAWAVFLTLFVAFHSAAQVRVDYATTEANGEVRVRVLDNDDLVGDVRIDAPSALNGTASVKNQNQTILYKPDPNFVGTDLIRYDIYVDGEKKYENTLTVTVTGVDATLTTDHLLELSRILLIFLVVALLLEFALDRIFDFRWFIRYFEGRGLKLPVAVFFALLLIVPLGLDLVSEIASVLTGKEEKSWWLSYFLSALIISGGSATIFRLYKAFGLRTPIPGLTDAEREKDFGRVKVRIIGQPENRPEAPLEVYIGGKLYGTIAGNTSEYPSVGRPSLPIRTGDQEFAVAIAPLLEGDGYWKRRVGIAKLQRVTVLFDLSKPTNVTYSTTQNGQHV